MSQIKQKKRWITEEQYQNIFKRVITVLNDHEIHYWLEFGTLLGYVREKKRIAWDADIDIAIDGVDFDKALGLLSEFQTSGFTVGVKQEKGCYRRIVMSDDEIPAFHVDLYEFKLIDGKYTYKWIVTDSLPTKISYKVFELFVVFKCDGDPSKYYVGEPENFLFMGVRNIFRAVNSFFGKHRMLVFNQVGFVEREYYDVVVRVPVNSTEHLLLNYGLNWKIPDDKHSGDRGGIEFIEKIRDDGCEICYILNEN